MRRFFQGPSTRSGFGVFGPAYGAAAYGAIAVSLYSEVLGADRAAGAASWMIAKKREVGFFLCDREMLS